MPAPSRQIKAAVAETTQPKQAKKKGDPLVDADSNTVTGKSTTSRPTYAQVVASKQSKASRALGKPVGEGNSDLQGSTTNEKSVSSVENGLQGSHTREKVGTSLEKGSHSGEKPADPLDKENVSNRSHRDRRPSEKIVANRTTQEEAARRQQMLDANRAERAKRAERKANKANGIDRPAQSDDENRDIGTFSSHSVVTKQAAKKAALVQRDGKVPPNTPALHSQQRSPERYRSRSPQRGHHMSTSRHLSHSPLGPRGRASYYRRSRSPRGRRMSNSRSRSRQGRRMSLYRSPTPWDDPMEFSPSPRGQPRSKSRSTSPRQDPSRSGSPEPVIGQKRSYSPTDDGLLQLAKAQKVSEGGGRPKASDYDEVSKEVILRATAIYRCLVSTRNAFPTPSEEADMIKIAWNRANEETSQQVPIALTPPIAKVISARGSQIRSEVKTRAIDYVETLYGFNSGHGNSILRRNRRLAEDLKKNHSGYLYKNHETQKGLYQHPIIQKIVNRCWFNNSRDEGIVYADLFDPLSVEAIALVLTAIECGIDAWATGVNVEVSFYGADYKSLYLRHVKTLNAFGIATSKHDLLGKLQHSLFNFGRVHAGVPSTISQNETMLCQDDFIAAMKDYENDSETEEDGEDID